MTLSSRQGPCRGGIAIHTSMVNQVQVKEGPMMKTMSNLIMVVKGATAKVKRNAIMKEAMVAMMIQTIPINVRCRL